MPVEFSSVMTCMCNSTMLVALIMPRPQPVHVPMHGICAHCPTSLSTPSTSSLNHQMCEIMVGIASVDEDLQGTLDTID